MVTLEAEDMERRRLKEIREREEKLRTEAEERARKEQEKRELFIQAERQRLKVCNFRVVQSYLPQPCLVCATCVHMPPHYVVVYIWGGPAM